MYCLIQELLAGGRKLCKNVFIYATARSSENDEFAGLFLLKAKFCQLNNCLLPLSNCKTRSLR